MRELLQWQWTAYHQFHGSRFNLLLHLIVVPCFLIANVLFIVSLFNMAPWAAIACLVSMLISIALQGFGHKKEVLPSIPFTGPGNAIARLFLEQWISFPRFVISGGWWRAYMTH